MPQKSCLNLRSAFVNVSSLSNWANLIARIYIIVGVIWAFYLFSEIGIKLVVPSATSSPSNSTTSSLSNTTNYVAVKIVYLVGNAVRAAMGIFLFIAIKNEDSPNLKWWMIVNAILVLVDILVVTPVAVCLGQVDLVGIWAWELPFWIVRVISIWIIYRFKVKLEDRRRRALNV